jgi:hypothetical protein
MIGRQRHKSTEWEYVVETNRVLGDSSGRFIRHLQRGGLGVQRLPHKTTFVISRDRTFSFSRFLRLLASLMDPRLGSLLMHSKRSGRTWIMSNRGRLHAVLDLSGENISAQSIVAECSGPPHRHPTKQPGGMPAVYAFFYQGRCLKCGQVGPNSEPRYCYQHYNPNSAPSTFAAQLLKRGGELGLSDIPQVSIGGWIESNTARANVLFPVTITKRTLNFAEALFHLLWEPVFEGREWRN